MKTGDKIKYNSEIDIGEEPRWAYKEWFMYLCCIKVINILLYQIETATTIWICFRENNNFILMSLFID